MPGSSGVTAMRAIVLAAAGSVLAACGGRDTPAAGDADSRQPASAPAIQAAEESTSIERNGRYIDPDGASMVLLYYSLAGLEPPLDEWARQDPSVVAASPQDRPAVRDARRAELESGLAAAERVGALQFSVQTAVGYYDPTCGEFTIAALAPSSVIEFRSRGYEVGLRFGNARHAQLWGVPADEAEQIGDRYGRPFDARLDVIVGIRTVQPGTRGGTIVGDVLEYELRENGTGALIAHVDVPPQ